MMRLIEPGDRRQRLVTQGEVRPDVETETVQRNGNVIIIDIEVGVCIWTLRWRSAVIINVHTLTAGKVYIRLKQATAIYSSLYYAACSRNTCSIVFQQRDDVV